MCFLFDSLGSLNVDEEEGILKRFFFFLPQVESSSSLFEDSDHGLDLFFFDCLSLSSLESSLTKTKTVNNINIEV